MTDYRRPLCRGECLVQTDSRSSFLTAGAVCKVPMAVWSKSLLVDAASRGQMDGWLPSRPESVACRVPTEEWWRLERAREPFRVPMGGSSRFPLVPGRCKVLMAE